MSTPQTPQPVTPYERRRLRAHFGVSHLPFSHKAWAKNMFDSQSQRELLDALAFWTELRGIALAAGPAGVGKSITVRRFVHDLDEERYRVFLFSYLPTTVNGFLRSLARALGIPLRQRSADLFDAAKDFLGSFEQDHGPHPLLVIDDAEGLRPQTLDLLRRLTCYELDAEPRFSLLLAGTDQLFEPLRAPAMAPLRSRIAYTHILRPFGLEDTRNYVQDRLKQVDADPNLFSQDAVRKLFLAARGLPRNINQIAIQALIIAAVYARDRIDGDFMARLIADHPLYHVQDTGDPTP